MLGIALKIRRLFYGCYEKYSGLMFFLALLCPVMFSIKALANSQKEITGVLQAYWFPQWTEEGKPKPSIIMMRFLETVGKGEQTYYLYDSKEKNGVKDYFNVKQTEKFIRSNFKNTPEEFFKFKEGHTEQAGVLSLSERMVIAECDSKKNLRKIQFF